MVYKQSRIFSDVDALLDTILKLLNEYEKIGPLLGIGLPFIEAFIPLLPLFVFVMANSMSYGLFFGFFLSWLGSVAGAFTVFSLIRYFKKHRFIQKFIAQKQVKKVTEIVERRGFTLLFMLLCFPFSPSSLINIVTAISNVSNKQFLLALVFGKAVMIFSISYVGTSILEFAKHPLRTIVVISAILLFWVVGKRIEKRLLHT